MNTTLMLTLIHIKSFEKNLLILKTFLLPLTTVTIFSLHLKIRKKLTHDS